LGEGEQKFIVTRMPGLPVNIVVNGRVGERKFSAELLVPSVLAPSQTQAVRRAPILLSDLRDRKQNVRKDCGMPPYSNFQDRDTGLYNLALLKTAKAGASTVISDGQAQNKVENLNDGFLTNCAAWISKDGEKQPWVEIDLGRIFDVSRVTISEYHNDRSVKAARVELRADTKSDPSVQNFMGNAGRAGANVFVGATVQARLVRIVVLDWIGVGGGGAGNGIDFGPRIDEVEIYGK
jgi:hypothetical protein